jgi:hypothetical protein
VRAAKVPASTSPAEVITLPVAFVVEEVVQAGAAEALFVSGRWPRGNRSTWSATPPARHSKTGTVCAPRSDRLTALRRSLSWAAFILI